jgi:hypothetical protein
LASQEVLCPTELVGKQASKREIPTLLENQFMFISFTCKNANFAVLQETELMWEFEFLTAGIWRLSSFKTWRSVFWSKSTYVVEELISSFVMAEYLEDGGSFFAES